MVTAEGPKFIPALHLLRGLCAVGVALYHFMAWSYDVTIGSMGTFGVYTFFTLSAVVLLLNDQRHFAGGIPPILLKDFYRRRLARVMPLLAVVAVAVAVYAYGVQGASPWGLWRPTVLTASGAFALHMPGMISMTVGAWSLAIELVFYALFPLLVLLAADLRFRHLLIVFLVLAAMQQIVLGIMPASDDPRFWSAYTMPLTFAPFFAGGFLIHRWIGRSDPRAFWLCLASLAILFSYSAFVSSDVFLPGIQYLFLMGLSLASVAFAYRASLPAWLLAPSIFLGNISYSLYLTHWFAYQAVASWVAESLRLPAFVLLALALAWASMKLVEEPARRRFSRAR